MTDVFHRRVEQVVDAGIRAMKLRPDQRSYYLAECDSLEKLAALEEQIARTEVFGLIDAEVRLCRARGLDFRDYRRALLESHGFGPPYGVAL